MERRRVIFKGSVQGVGFRVTARGVAHRHPVTGWIRNEPDHSVRMEVQGPSTAVTACIEELRAFRTALIRDMDVEDVPLVQGESGFEIQT